MNERTAFAAMDEQAEWAQKNNPRRVLPIKRMNDLDREFAPGVITRYKRERKNPRLGLLICCIGALTVIGLIGWAWS